VRGNRFKQQRNDRATPCKVCSDRNIEDNPRETISTGATRATPSAQEQPEQPHQTSIKTPIFQ